MKKIQYQIIVLLVIVMALAACSTGENKNQSTESGNEAETNSELQPYEINFVFIGTPQKDIAEVEAAMNKITTEKINATVKLTPVEYGAWDQRINLMLVGNEKVDLMFSGLRSYGLQVAKKQLMPLDDLVSKFGPNITKSLDPAYLNAPKVNNQLYGIPSVREFASQTGILMRKDIVDKYKIDITAIQSFNDLDGVFKTVQENEPSLTPLVALHGGQPLLDIVAPNTGELFDDRLGFVPFDGNSQIANWFESKEYAERVNTARRWFESGYVSKNIATSKEEGRDLVKANAAFSYFTKLKPGKAEEDSRAIGTEMIAVTLDESISITSMITNSMMSIPSNAKNPERSMMFLDLLYHDQELINLIDWGIEGKHYVKKDENRIGFPDGVDAANSGYNLNQSWMFGNQFLSYLWETNSSDLYEQIKKFNESARKAETLGFTYDINPVKTQVANITNVMNEYRIGLESGTLDPAEALPQFIGKLKSAGINDVISMRQKQLDAWKATQ